MRMTFLVVAVLTTGLVLADGAPAAGQNLTIGPVVGVNLSDFSLDPDLDTDSQEGLVAGVSARYGVPGAPNLGIQSGAYFTQKGATVFVGSTPLTFDLSYVELPLVLAAELPLDAGNLVPRLFAGGRIGFELNCGVRSPGSSLDFDCRDPALRAEDAEFRTRTTDLGLLVGGGIAFPVAPGRFTMEARYDIGMTNVNDAGTSTARTFKNRTLTFVAGYHVPIF